MLAMALNRKTTLSSKTTIKHRMEVVVRVVDKQTTETEVVAVQEAINLGLIKVKANKNSLSLKQNNLILVQRKKAGSMSTTTKVWTKK